MKQRFTIPILLLLTILVSACVPGGSPSKGRRANSSQGSTNSTDNSSPPTFDSTQEVYWYSGTKVEGTITVNEDIQTVIYLRGQGVHNFLSSNSNSSKSFCLVTSYNSSNPGALKHLRARAVPISFNNFSTGTLERLLRIDVSDLTSNSSLCTGSAPYIDAFGNQGASVAAAAYYPPALCPTCSGILSSTNVSLYDTAIGLNQRIPSSQLNLSTMGLRIDVNNNTTTPGGSCTNSGCQSQGYDCCLNGQCVNDGQEKPNASSEADYATAINDVASNPANFIHWPNIYFVCPSTTPNPNPQPDPLPTPPNPQTQLEADIKLYNCLEEGKNTTPDFAGAGVCEPGFDQASYEAIRSQVWARCGCEANPFPTDPADPRCPDFGLKPIKDSSNNIQAIICDIPDNSTSPSPFQGTVSVSSRSAPHRFYASDGTNVDDLTEIAGTTVVQEGTTFTYLDKVSKTGPQNGDFNMNSVLGQMDVALDQTRPAQMVTVEYDQTYIIRANSGYYTACPTCTEDKWYSAFKPHPPSQSGTGLRSVGYTTNRSSYDFNTTLGNYEDTIFGRACWVPPTMIPFSHQKASTVQTQRLNRLATQSAYFVNGYQRDWYGFNKGALIGSFDGVTWFAIGTGRRVQAKSTKLFLAINAPFADLASNTSLSVSVIQDLGNNVAADFDYDPSYSLIDSRQNDAGTCQAWHSCNVDSDCVTKLGWEYVCADVSQFKTKWPKFDLNGDEKANDELSTATFMDILHGGYSTAIDSKRCVYRGAGAPCKRSFQTNLSATKQEIFTCAPNFYCESLGGNQYNSEIAREPSAIEISSIQFGQDADVLGRPLSYIGGGQSLTTAIQSNVQYNAAIHSSAFADFGICRPGRRISVDDVQTQHANRDPQGRADYISQIGSCDSALTGNSRLRACPVFETDESKPNGVEVGDYILHNNTGTDAAIYTKRRDQNMCGGEAQKEITVGTFESAFKFVEAERLSSVTSLVSPTLVKDACLRRPGSVCHTDLDCGPNYLHEQYAQSTGITYFGNTEAELNYWLEPMVCGQAESEPLLQASNYYNYDVTKNRCCREIGNDITMYTQGDTTIIPDLGTNNTLLDTDRLPEDDPTASGRYSRYAIANPSSQDAPASPIAQTPAVVANTTPKPYQWKTVNDTGKGSCCGGGWIRKFADGTNDWSNTQRLQLDYTKFSCLNYESTLNFTKPNFVDNVHYNRELDKTCLYPADGGCSQVAISASSGFEVRNPTTVATPTGTIITTPTGSTPTAATGTSSQAPYPPIPYLSPTFDSGAGGANQQNLNYASDPSFDLGISFYIPIYINAEQGDQSAINAVRLDYKRNNSSCAAKATLTQVDPCPVADNTPGIFDGPTLEPTGLAVNEYCVEDTTTGSVMHIRANDATCGGNWDYAGVEIDFDVVNTDAFVAGNDLYYLTKMSRFELVGIPQIFYEPVYCNTQGQTLVEGFFNLSTQDRATFEAQAFVYSNAVTGHNLREMYDSTNTVADPSNPTEYITYQDKVDVPQIFSGHEFMCCLELGQETTSASKCCSGHSKNGVCKLPKGANVNVYFNRFVSGDGTGDTQPGGGLEDDDFVPETGEPKLRQSTYDKLAALGQAYCENGIVRQGTAFGNFYGEPNSGFFLSGNDPDDNRLYSIIDSLSDYEPSNDKGAVRFQNGYRWDHHFYCD